MKIMIAFLLAMGLPAAPAHAAAPWPAPSGAYPADPADSLYSAARAALAEKRYGQAADLFHRIATDYPGSQYASTALYYEAFSHYKMGTTEDLRSARQGLSTLAAKYPTASHHSDATALEARVCGVLAQRGDTSCQSQLTHAAQDDTSTCATKGGDGDEDDNDTRIAAMNALMQVDAEKALPILKHVLARRDRCSVGLRRKALFIVSQKESPESADLLLASARSDPDEDVRQQAVFWLSQVQDPRAVTMVDSVLEHSTDEALREKALFALSQQQQRDGRGGQMLRQFASRTSEPQELREKALFWIGQTGNDDDAAWLKTQFAREPNEDLKEKILFSVSQHWSGASSQWLINVASDSTQTPHIRKQAIFWAGQGGASLDQLMGLYDRTHDADTREGVLFAVSQRDEPAAVDALMKVARSDRDPKLRKRAIFWLGQSRDPRAAQFLAQLIDR